MWTGRLRGDGGGSTAVDVNAALRLLSDPLCRHTLKELAERPTNYHSYEKLVDSYLEANPDAESFDRDSVEIQCHNAHVPALANEGLIDYDAKSKEVRYDSNQFVEEVLDVIGQWES